jgi:endonuclease/exonuclease/phosphatase family metal-dependent hydrolase
MQATRYRFALLALIPLTAWLASLSESAQAPAAPLRPYLFCFWNVENFFDDKLNPKLEKADRAFDDYFAKDKEALENKLDRLCEVLLGKELNNGKGPDILAVAEIESQRAVELLRDALNKRLKDKNLHYKTVVYRDPQGGRSIATALITRVPVTGTPRLLGRHLRILEVKLVENKHELTIIASHWTSRVSDSDGRGRSNYARLIHDNYRDAYRKNANVDYLVCGDFNDNPNDEAVQKDLGAIGDLKKVLSLEKGDRPLLYNPFFDFLKMNKGTHQHQGRNYVFDNICLSPGMLDGDGWQYVNKSAAIVEKFNFRGRPDRFGGPEDKRPWRNRGASDHFPVTIQMRVAK